MPFLGIEIGGTKLQIVAGDHSGVIARRWRFNVDPAAGGEGIRKQIRSSIDEILETADPEAIGVGFGGPVDRDRGRIFRSHQIEGWADFDLAEWLHRLTGRPVLIENDANSGALGEAVCGAGKGFNPVFYITLGSGVGGGLAVDGRIYHGTKPGEAEIGHVRLSPDGTIVEHRCSGWAVDAKIRKLKESGSSSLLCKLVGNSTGGEARHLSSALAQNDPAAWEILRETARDLAFALSHVTHLFHPEVIVVGGGLSLIGEPLRNAIVEALPEFLMDVFRPGPHIRLAGLGEDAVPVGALLVARSALEV
jgi:glucokinase